jgi:hypothetical protein
MNNEAQTFSLKPTLGLGGSWTQWTRTNLLTGQTQNFIIQERKDFVVHSDGGALAFANFNGIPPVWPVKINNEDSYTGGGLRLVGISADAYSFYWEIYKQKPGVFPFYRWLYRTNVTNGQSSVIFMFDPNQINVGLSSIKNVFETTTDFEADLDNFSKYGGSICSKGGVVINPNDGIRVWGQSQHDQWASSYIKNGYTCHLLGPVISPNVFRNAFALIIQFAQGKNLFNSNRKTPPLYWYMPSYNGGGTTDIGNGKFLVKNNFIIPVKMKRDLKMIKFIDNKNYSLGEKNIGVVYTGEKRKAYFQSGASILSLNQSPGDNYGYISVKNAGTESVVIKVDADEDHSVSSEIQIGTITVAKAAQSLIWPENDIFLKDISYAAGLIPEQEILNYKNYYQFNFVQDLDITPYITPYGAGRGSIKFYINQADSPVELINNRLILKKVGVVKVGADAAETQSYFTSSRETKYIVIVPALSKKQQKLEVLNMPTNFKVQGSNGKTLKLKEKFINVGNPKPVKIKITPANRARLI